MSKFGLSFDGRCPKDVFDGLREKIKAKGGTFEMATRRWVIALDANDPLFAHKELRAEALDDNYEPIPNPPRA